jgi:hypothetical protein
MTLLSASGEFLLDFPSPRHLSSSVSYPLDLSGLGDPTGSNATAGLALRVIGTHKALYHGKVEIPTKGTKVVDKIKTHFLLYNFSSENPAIYEIMWKNMVQPDGSQMTI